MADSTTASSTRSLCRTQLTGTLSGAAAVTRRYLFRFKILQFQHWIGPSPVMYIEGADGGGILLNRLVLS